MVSMLLCCAPFIYVGGIGSAIVFTFFLLIYRNHCIAFPFSLLLWYSLLPFRVMVPVHKQSILV